MWMEFAGKKNEKNVYGVILVDNDNLEPDIALKSVKIPDTIKVELGKTYTFTPTFTPTNATNKIITWTSSDETVATVDNGGKVTPKKLGSAIITVKSEDGNKTDTCTVTVVSEAANNNNTNNNANNNSNNSVNNETNQNQETNTSNNENNNNTEKSENKNETLLITTNSDGKDNTTAKTKIPQTGVGIGIFVAIAIVALVAIISKFKLNKYNYKK